MAATSAMAGEWNSSSLCADDFHLTAYSKEQGRMMRGDGFYRFY
eukprot:CAMPEP_0198270384 /NCGR_PEP_ID=MMETSP1447-20131203/44848_1 /TAXON_ID=420782 /ORGANISM="Chaetoceros dichaeta, Strain CCMP1751" /LENGTH=43 /DNA_ID= /DNA_START= /DNA_END= /DNA_ORIENTATION=